MVIKGYGERVRLTGKPSEGEGGVDVWLLRGMILKEERERGEGRCKRGVTEEREGRMKEMMSWNNF